eukprot:363549-Chlamydomonas_euryale.AAC.10
MPVLSAARQRGKTSGRGAVTKEAPLCVALSPPIPNPSRRPGCERWAQSNNSPIPLHGSWSAYHPVQTHQLFRKQQWLDNRPIRHPARGARASPR